MKRVNLDTVDPSVRKFIQSLPVDSEGASLLYRPIGYRKIKVLAERSG